MTTSQTLIRNLRVNAIAAAVIMHVYVTTLHAAPPATRANYFGDNNTPNVVALLPMPPAAGSQEENADREASLTIYTSRAPAQVALGKSQNKLSVFNFTPSLGVWFKKGKFPKTEVLFAQIDREAKAIITSAKKYYQRPHPFQIDSTRFSDVIDKDDTGSYPSDHATRGTLFALLLIELFPQQRDALQAQGREIGWLRVQGGVNTPLDVYSGRVLGRAMAQALMRNPDYLADLDAAREEIATVLAAESTAAAAAQN